MLGMRWETNANRSAQVEDTRLSLTVLSYRNRLHHSTLEMTRSVRMLSLLLACVSCFAFLAIVGVSASRSSHPDQVFNLPGQSFTPTFNHYSGYISLPDSPTMLHYWFV